MKLSLIILFFLAGLSMVLTSSTKGANETDSKGLKSVDFGESASDSKPNEAQRKRDSGNGYKKGIRFNRLRLRSGHRGRLTKQSAQLNRPFKQYGLPSTDQEQSNLRPHQYRQPSTSSDSLQNQGVPTPVRNYEFVEPSSIASQNDVPLRIDDANSLPPRNQKLPSLSTPSVFSTSQSHQNQQLGSQEFAQQELQDQRISDAAHFLTQNAQTLSQLYGAPASNQEYAPNNEYVSQSTGQQHNFNSQVENLQGSPGFAGALPSYASGVLNSQEALRNVQSLEKNRLLAQLRQSLVNQASFQNVDPLGRNAPTEENIQHQTGSDSGNPGGSQSVSPSVFGGVQATFGQVPFLSGSTVSPPGFGLEYGLSTPSHVPATPATAPQPQGSSNNPSGSIVPGLATGLKPSITPGFPQYGIYFPTLVPGTNFVANVPAFGSGFFSPSSVNIPSHPASSSPTQFGIPIPVLPGPKPISGTPTLSISPTLPSIPGISSLVPDHPVSNPLKPVYPVRTPGNIPIQPGSIPIQPVNTPVVPVNTPVNPVLNPAAVPAHPVATPVLPIRPVTASRYPAVHPTYGVQSSFVNSLFLKPLRPVLPIYYYPNVQLQFQKPVSTIQPWNYAPTYQQARPIWK